MCVFAHFASLKYYLESSAASSETESISTSGKDCFFGEFTQLLVSLLFSPSMAEQDILSSYGVDKLELLEKELHQRQKEERRKEVLKKHQEVLEKSKEEAQKRQAEEEDNIKNEIKALTLQEAQLCKEQNELEEILKSTLRSENFAEKQAQEIEKNSDHTIQKYKEKQSQYHQQMKVIVGRNAELLEAIKALYKKPLEELERLQKKLQSTEQVIKLEELHKEIGVAKDDLLHPTAEQESSESDPVPPAGESDSSKLEHWKKYALSMIQWLESLQKNPYYSQLTAETFQLLGKIDDSLYFAEKVHWVSLSH